MHLTLIDFGSAVDAPSLARLYGQQGPGAEELTLEYAPPECLFGDYWKVRLGQQCRLGWRLAAGGWRPGRSAARGGRVLGRQQAGGGAHLAASPAAD
jgi:hypothetical protein